MILRDGHIGTGHYPASTPVLAQPAKPAPELVPASLDRVTWVTVLRPMLFAAGNMVRTEEHAKEEAAIRRQVARDARDSTPPPIRLANGTWVPGTYRAEGEVDPESAAPAKVVPRDGRAAASGEKDEPDPEQVPDCPF